MLKVCCAARQHALPSLPLNLSVMTRMPPSPLVHPKGLRGPLPARRGALPVAPRVRRRAPPGPAPPQAQQGLQRCAARPARCGTSWRHVMAAHHGSSMDFRHHTLPHAPGMPSTCQHSQHQIRLNALSEPVRHTPACPPACTPPDAGDETSLRTSSGMFITGALQQDPVSCMLDDRVRQLAQVGAAAGGREGV